MSYCSSGPLDRSRRLDSSESIRPMCENGWGRSMSSAISRLVLSRMATISPYLVHCRDGPAHTVVAEATKSLPIYSVGAIHAVSATVNSI